MRWKPLANKKRSRQLDFAELTHAGIGDKLNISSIKWQLEALIATLDMVAYLCDICPGDEVVFLGFAFSRTAVAFIFVGANLTFEGICFDTMNGDDEVIKKVLSFKSKGIVAMHYVSVSCNADSVIQFTMENSVFVVENAAKGFMSIYRNSFMGMIETSCTIFSRGKELCNGEDNCYMGQLLH